MKKRIELHQPLLVEQQNEERFFHITANSLEVIAYSAVSPEKETPNEDCLAIIPLDEKECILAIADGAGGSRQGGDASRLAVGALDQVLREKSPEQDLRTCVLNAYELANARIMELGVGASTTLTVIEYADGRIRPYHAGDTMIMHVGLRGRIRYQTVPHSPTGYAVEAGLLEEDAALHHEDRHLVTNILGHEDLRVEIGSFYDMARHDTIVIGSDGLYDNLYKEEIIERIRKGPLRRAAQRLAADVRERMLTEKRRQPSKADDLSFMLIRQRQTTPQRRGAKTQGTQSKNNN